ncbi:hypothetical protein GW17_00047727 [Ensete ventricosum]|nr:hypothetical protein GW17_00047727 [Ensete ventricosum]
MASSSTNSGFSFAPSSSSVSPPRAESHRSSDTESGWFEPCSSSSSIMTQANIKAFRALEVMMSCHDFDSILTFESLVRIRKRYSIPDEYALHALSPGQRPNDEYPRRFNISFDALEVGLRFYPSSRGGHEGKRRTLGKMTHCWEVPLLKKVKISDRHMSRREGEGSKSHPSKGKESVRSASETPAPLPRRSKSMKELCQISAGKRDAGYYTLRMTDLLVGEPEVPLEVRWPTLKKGMKIWVDGAAWGEYARDVLIPHMAANLYSSPSELLVDRTQHYYMALADRVHDAGWVINVMDNKSDGLKKEIADLQAWSGPEVVVAVEQRALEAQALADHMKDELEEVDRRRALLEMERENYRLDLVNA